MKKRELDLNKLFKAKSIAVLGVSNDRKKLGRIVYDNLKKSQFQGSVFAVNNRGLKIAKEKTYLSLSEIPEKIDLLIIAIPAIFVKDALLEAVRLKIGAVVLISAGFKESGKLDLENEIMQIAKKHKLALLGPNCLGFLNPYLKINASFFDAKLKPGKIAFLSQSGALGSVILDQAKELLLGFSLFVSSGNRAVLDEADFLNYLSHDKNTEILAIYAEALKETKRLIPAIQNFNKEKKRPIIVLKSGTSPLGAKASLSHTGALAGKDAIYQAFFQDQSLLRAKNLEELFDLLQIFNHNKHEKLKNTLILSNAGGPAVLAVDEAFRENLSLAKLSPGLKRSLAKILPSSASINNPLDILGDADPERLSAALDLLALEKDIDSLLIIISPQSMTNPSLMAQKIVEFREK